MNWIHLSQVVGFCRKGSEPSGFKKCMELLDYPRNRLASQTLCSMELINLWITAEEYSDHVTIPENTTFHTTIIKFITVLVFYVCLLSNAKYKVFFVFTAHDVMKTYTRVEAQLHAFSTFTTRWRLVDKFYAPTILFPGKVFSKHRLYKRLADP